MSEAISVQPRILGCKTKYPLRFSVCGQLVSLWEFTHHRRRFDENVLIMVTEGTLYVTANNIQFNVNAVNISCFPQAKSISDFANPTADCVIFGRIFAQNAVLKR